MNICFRKDIKNIEENKLQELFASVQWESSKYPEKLQQAIKNSHQVVTAWQGEELIGLINSLSDGVMTAYFHYMLVKPQYQENGVGKKLLALMLDEYQDFPTKVLISYENSRAFYEKCGFKIENGTTPYFITELV